MTIAQGDCLTNIQDLNPESVDLIYLDPPFFSQRKHRLTNKNKKTLSFEDKWDSKEQYIKYMKDRLSECYRVLKKTGSIFVHCDKNASYIFREILEEIFGPNNFQSEIIWAYKRWSNSKKGLLNSHQTILFYSKTANFKFNKFYTNYSVTTNLDQILQERERDTDNKAIYKKDEQGNIILAKNKKGVPLSDVWNIPYLNPRAKERVGYPTQKPLILLERIIRLTTDVGDCVLDPFCGSGTTLVAAKLLNRNYIGFDISKDAISITKERLNNPIKTDSALLQKGKKAYITKDKKSIEFLDSIGAKPVYRNKGIDGIVNDQINNQVIPIKIQKENETIYDSLSLLSTALKKKNLQRGIVIRTHNSLIEIPNREFKNIQIINSPKMLINNWLTKENNLDSTKEN